MSIDDRIERARKVYERAVFSGDTEVSPYGGGAWASRGASMGGEAAVRAGRARSANAVRVLTEGLRQEVKPRRGRVRRLLAARKGRTFADIAAALPSETRMYVPKVCATIAVRAGVAPEKISAPRS